MVHQLDEFDDTQSFLCSWGFPRAHGVHFPLHETAIAELLQPLFPLFADETGSIVHSVLLFCYLMLPALIAGTTPLHVDSRRNQNSQILLEIHGS